MVTELGSGMKFDLQKLIATRLLIQANSGGGKSYALRKLLEVTYGHVQHIAIPDFGFGNFQNCISKLKKRGCIEVDGQNLRAGKMPPEVEKQITSGDIPYRLEDWVRQLSGCARAIYDYVLSNPGKVFGRMEVAKATGYHVTSGNFQTCISKLNTLGLIKKHGTSLELNPEIRNV